MNPPDTARTDDHSVAAVANAVQRLEGVADLGLDQRADAFHAIHDDLRSALAEIDDA